MSATTVLVVEDHDPFRRLICSMLGRTPDLHVVGEEVEGLRALQRAEELRPDLILLDISLPDVNGLEIAKGIRELASGAKIIFVSQESSEDVVQAAFNLGAMGCVHKSHIYGDLLPAINAVLAGARFLGSGLECEGDQFLPHHEVLFCSDDLALVHGLARFIAAALKGGDAAIVCASQTNRDHLIPELRGLGVDIDNAARRRTYVPLDSDEPFDMDKVIEVVRNARKAAAGAGKEHPRVAVCGERAGRLWAEGKKDTAIWLEQLCNRLAKSEDIDILCPYPYPRTEEEARTLRDIFVEHTTIRSGETK